MQPRPTRNFGLAGGVLTPPDGLAWRLRNESLRNDEYFQWTPLEAYLYVDLGVDRAEFHANWGVA